MKTKYFIKLHIFIIININVYTDINKYEIIKFQKPTFIMDLLYEDIWGTIYHAEERQCDKSPTITGDGSKLNPNKASELRWIAISQDMLNLPKGLKILKDSTIDIFKGKITYGDSVWIESNNPRIKGWWVVHDAKHPRVKKSIDFLQTKGDGNLYHNNKLWSGRFLDLKIYKKISIL